MVNKSQRQVKEFQRLLPVQDCSRSGKTTPVITPTIVTTGLPQRVHHGAASGITETILHPWEEFLQNHR